MNYLVYFCVVTSVCMAGGDQSFHLYLSLFVPGKGFTQEQVLGRRDDIFCELQHG